MENTKENRLKYLREHYNLLLDNKNRNMVRLLAGANQLNATLKRRRTRQVIMVEKWSDLWSELSAELSADLWSELRSELSADLRSELSAELWSDLWSVWEFYETGSVLFINDFDPRLAVLQSSNRKKKLAALRAIEAAGNAYMFLTKTRLYVIPFPEIYVLDKRLHNTSGYACKFLDKESYWLFGVKFEKDLWEKIVSKKLPAKEILVMNNMEQRMVALKIYDQEKLFSEIGAPVIHTHIRETLTEGGVRRIEYRLYKVCGVFPQDEYFVTYRCPSTDRFYSSCVDTSQMEDMTAEAAMAWKQGRSIEEYRLLEVES